MPICGTDNEQEGEDTIIGMNRHKRVRCALALLTMLTAGLLSGCVSDAASDSKLPTLTVGSDTYPPYVYMDNNGDITGLDVEIAEEAFRRMGYRAEFTTIDWEKKTELVDSGEIDCIWGSFSIDGREDQYLWTEPYLYSRQVVAVRQDSDIQTLADLAGKRVAVQSTTKPEELFLALTDPRIPRVAEVFSLQDRELIYPYLSKGYADALAAHETAILQCMSDYSLDYRILDEPLLTVGLGVAFARTDQRGLDKELSRTIEEMRAAGSLEQIVGRYLDEPQRLLEVTPCSPSIL